jgi:3-hydroxyisobutyrate dehydrogenase-like beta-hydroxyacid dehydrogenase
MAAQRIGILHPGQMGIVVAVSAQNSGNEVFWASEHRSAATRKRATEAGLRDAGTLAELCKLCSLIVSVCPPESAEQTAEQVARHSYKGTYVDANAISVDRTQRIARRLEAPQEDAASAPVGETAAAPFRCGVVAEECGARFVDGGIIGPPTTTRNRTWLYLAGEHAAGIAPCFSSGPIEVEVLAGGVGRASALKMCFAAYSKGSIALACAVLAAAASLDVFDDLKRQWARGGPSLSELEREISRAAPKAWRFTGEMREIAATFASAGVPPEFHKAAEEIFRGLEHFKGRDEPSLQDVLATLLK